MNQPGMKQTTTVQNEKWLIDPGSPWAGSRLRKLKTQPISYRRGRMFQRMKPRA